jgi:L-alanine-DL-glutamate epimerase-like enolase superfamily enzyme
MTNKVKIETIKWFKVDAGWRDWLILEIKLSSGLTGYSEFTDSNGSVPTLLEAIKEISKDVIEIKNLDVDIIIDSLRRKYRQSLPGILWKAISAYENALWDLKSKLEERTISDIFLFKSIEKEITLPAYWSHCPTTRMRAGKFLRNSGINCKEELKSLGEEIEMLGFKAFKTNLISFTPGPRILMPGFNKEFTLQKEALPPRYPVELKTLIEKITSSNKDLEIILDLNYNLNPQEFDEIQNAMNNLKIKWFEIDFDDIDNYEQILNNSSFPICTGENILGNFHYDKIISDERISVISIDVLWNGISESIKIANQAIKNNKKIAVHNYYGGIATSIAMVFLSMIPREHIELVEFDYDDVYWRDQIVDNPVIFEEGSLKTDIGYGWNNNFILEKAYKWIK